MIGNDWDKVLDSLYAKEDFKLLLNNVKNEYKNKVIYPNINNVFECLKLTSYENTKVVIVGQDPYHGENEANGLAFSVSKGIKIPPSLKNIYKELQNDLNLNIPNTGDLTSWAKEGVLLLNSSLTVIKDTPNSHKDIGWQILTDYIIKKLNEKKTPVVFIFWGNFARSKRELISNDNHLIIESPHPSPFSVNKGFFGSKPFSKTNNFLKQNNISEINWEIKS